MKLSSKDKHRQQQQQQQKINGHETMRWPPGAIEGQTTFDGRIGRKAGKRSK